MPGWNSKRFAAYGLVLTLAGLSAGLQTACHKTHRPDDLTQPPVVDHGIPAILATQGVDFASVTPQVKAWVYTEGVGSWVTSGFGFSVQPALPGNLTLNPKTGQITGTPTTVVGPSTFNISANNSIANGQGGTVTFSVSLGVQAASSLTLDYAGTGAVSTVVGGSVALDSPEVHNGVTIVPATGFGVNPALPAGLNINPDTGLISGSPTSAIPATSFTLTATTVSGSANASFTLLVAATQPVAPNNLAYPGIADPVVLAANQATAYTSPTPTVTTGTSLVYTVTPALPAGLSLDPLTGVISGIPAASNAGPVAYTVTASNAAGNALATVNLTVN
jgi:large repetitive protein